MSTTDWIEPRAAAAWPPERAVDGRCPYLIFHNVLGPEYVAGLLDHVSRRHADFHTGLMHDRQTGELFADPVVRDALYLNDLGTFAAPIKAFVIAIAAPALEALHLIEPDVEPREFIITAYGDGGHIADHIDTYKWLDRVRVLSCVYYFASTPRRFSGGELRLYGFPQRAAAGGEPPAPSFVDIEPRTDTLIVFPSWLRHRVLPVHVPTGTWADSRFTVNCWIHRAAAGRGKAKTGQG
jgi:SM-20-related protein